MQEKRVMNRCYYRNMKHQSFEENMTARIDVDAAQMIEFE